jgi:uncharacterized membrane protein YqaE (UPF0057 family)
MLGPGRYLLGTAELLLLIGFAWLGADRVRRRLVPSLRGAPANLGTTVLAAALLIWTAEILGTVSLFKPVPYLIAVIALGLSLRLGVSGRSAPPPAGGAVGGTTPEEALATGGGGGSPMATGPAGRVPGPSPVPTIIALLIAAIAVVHFATGVKSRLSTGMTGFDSTWYHAPFAAGFFQSGNTIDLHLIAPQFLAWFYPANSEILHAVGMLAFGRDLLSPLLNLGWFLGCLVACWCVGRSYGVAPWSLALGAIALSVPALSDQAGEARNDIVGIFFLLAAVAVALNCAAAEIDERRAGRGEGREAGEDSTERSLPVGALLLAGLAAGLAAGTKLNFLLPAAVLVLGLALIAPKGGRRRALTASGLAALAGGGYWYLRNLIHSGNPLPWIHHLGPIDLPAPAQALGGREAHSVLGYLGDGSVWSEWFLPGLHHALWIVWPLLAAAALAGLLLSLAPPLANPPRRRADLTHQRRPIGPSPAGVGRIGPSAKDGVAAVAGLVGLASAIAWLIAPTSASGPGGMPRGFESGLRYLAPALVIGLALLPTAASVRVRLARLATAGPAPGGRWRAWLRFPPHSDGKVSHAAGRVASWPAAIVGCAAVLAAVAVGYPVQRHYLRDRYADPTFTNPGLDAAFRWASGISDKRIATTSTRQYPLFGTDLSNHVQFVGLERPHGGFEAPATCREWRRLLNDGHYDYAVTTRDRIEPHQPPYPPEARWTESPAAKVILRKPPTVVFKLRAPLDPSTCP